MDARTEMLRQLADRRNGYSLPRAFYTDPDFYRLDLELIFYREWLFAGHDCELPKPGSYLTLQVGAYPVVVVRDKAGTIRAFHNSCRHRGSRICAAEKGKVAKLVCPYHRWTFELDGRLLFARDMGKDFDLSAFSLKPVHCRSVAGYIFICVADAAPDFAPVRAHLTPYLAPHRLAEAKVAVEMTLVEKGKMTLVEKGNWKLVWENNRECYHCRGNHPELCLTYPEAPSVTGVTGGQEDPQVAEHWRRCEAAGLPSALQISKSGQYRTARMPLLGDAVSYTMSGEPAVNRPLSDGVLAPRIGTMLLFHYPSSTTRARGTMRWATTPSPSACSRPARKRPWSPPSGSSTRMRSKASTTPWRSSRRSGSPRTSRTATSSRRTSSASTRRLTSRGLTRPSTKAA